MKKDTLDLMKEAAKLSEKGKWLHRVNGRHWAIMLEIIGEKG